VACAIGWLGLRLRMNCLSCPVVLHVLQMLAMKYMAVASFSRGSGSTPKLVALLANQEVQDEGGAQVMTGSCCWAAAAHADPRSRPEQRCPRRGR
jgi:hypothetical protein